MAAYIVILILGAGAGAALLRTAKAPGAAMLGGVVAGVLLGPTLLGRIAPQWYEVQIAGGHDQRRDLAVQEYRLARPAGEGLTRSESAPQFARDLKRREDLVDAWREAQWAHQSPLRIAMIALAAMFLMVSGMARSPRTTTRPDLYQQMSVGVWAAVVPGALAFLFLRLLDVAVGPSAAAAACLAVGAMTLSAVDRSTADDAEVGGSDLLHGAAWIASLLAIALLAWSTWSALGVNGMWAPAVFALLPIGWLVAWLLRPSPPHRDRRHSHILKNVGISPAGGGGSHDPSAIDDEARKPGKSAEIDLARSGRFLQRALDWILLPALAAMVASRIELFEHFVLWPIVVAVILSGDGRWLGAFMGAMLSGARKSLPTMRLVLGAMSAGTAQIAFTAVALGAGVIEEQLAYALILGAVVTEATAPFRRHTARRIEETEEEIEHLRHSHDE